jgi:PIN domain nuclease of toxin-antitoxin system
VNCLLDTHVFLWTVFSPNSLSPKARKTIEDPSNTIYVSAVTYWEISLKYAIGKLTLTNVLPDALPDIGRRMNFEILDVDGETASSFYKLPRHVHKDPFDRFIVWQGIRRKMTLITKDADLGFYKGLGLKTLW